ncbi:MAG: pyrroline-5-carboxylate reductase [Bdellovibrionales bacterium]|nr:pyrroline-5-carboxylate reductase [Bdellovibrionales bacterium]
MNHLLASKKVGFIGCGNMAQTIIKGWLDSQILSASHIFATNRSPGKLQKFAEEKKIQTPSSSEQMIEQVDVVVLAMKPQDLLSAIEDFQHAFSENQIVISLAAGTPMSVITKAINAKVRVARLMPNTPSSIKEGVIGYCTNTRDEELGSFIEDLFSPLGLVIETEEGEAFEALTVSAASGVGFVFELMIYWREWLEEHGFDGETASLMTIKTFLGASKLADQSNKLNLEELLAKVTSKQGVTAAGLNSMRELELERGLRYSFEKAVLRDRELSKSR